MLLVHTPEYLERVEKITAEPLLGLYEFEVPVSRAVVDACYLATGGTVACCREAITNNTCAINLAGGFHHAFAEHGEGFCIFNDVAVGTRVVQKEHLVKKVAVIDCDLHQGNGTAKIFEAEETVFTFSIHQQNNYPIKQRSDIDVGLEDYAGDERYLEELKKHLPAIFDQFKPQLVIYLAGADPYCEDKLGALMLSKEGLMRRDHLVFGLCHQQNVPVVALLAGGYAEDTNDVVDIHANMIKVALKYWPLL
jgi:acetoin utilization deacetylase AcuC-like enzyme